MVSPVVSKPNVTKSESYPGEAGWLIRYLSQTNRTAQKAPYNLPTSYQRYSGMMRTNGTSAQKYTTPAFPADSIPTAWYDDSYMTRASNQAYEKLRNSIYDSAGLGVDFVEYRQSLSMITQHFGTLVRAARAVRRLDFLAAAQILKMGLVPPGASVRKSFASNWLAYHFGYEPLMRDIHDACEVMNNPIKVFTKTSATGHDEKANYALFVYYGSTADLGWWRSRYRVRQGGSFRVTNWNDHLLEQMGVTNVASLAWEVIPFSFVVDWFVNVGDYLRSFTDYSGMVFDTAFTTRVYEVEDWRKGYLYSNPGLNVRFTYSYGQWIRRGAALTGPSLNTKKVTLPSVVRALTAVSLLTQVLTKK